MINWLSYVWLGMVWLLGFGSGAAERRPVAGRYEQPFTTTYSTSLRYNIYTFNISAADTGAVRELTVKAYRGDLLLTNFKTRIDGAIVNAEVADLDNNRFPELYVYSTSNGSGSFGRVYGWQFLLERKVDIRLVDWQKPGAGYMGHDSLWIERDILCRKFPVYRPGDTNAEPTGGVIMMRYRLQPAGEAYTLSAEQ